MQAATVSSSKTSEEVQKLEEIFKDKIQNLEEDLAEERKNGIQTEDKFDKYKEKMSMQEESFK